MPSFLGLCSLAMALGACSPRHAVDRNAVAATLQWQSGPVQLHDQSANIRLTKDFRFLGAEDARKVWAQLWGERDDPRLLGMIFPAPSGPMDSGAWCTRFIYGPGYVKDQEALDNDQVLAKLREFIFRKNNEKLSTGGITTQLVGWAVPPRYDPATHKLYWAEEITFNGRPFEREGHILDYGVCVLGRHGVLLLTVESTMKNLNDIDAKMQAIASFVDFDDGNRYSDFDPATDKVANYGLPGLIAAGTLGM